MLFVSVGRRFSVFRFLRLGSVSRLRWSCGLFVFVFGVRFARAIHFAASVHRVWAFCAHGGFSTKKVGN